MHKPLEKQKHAYWHLKNDKVRYVFYGGAAGGGKTWLGCEWLMMCGYELPGSRWFIGRNNLKDTRESVVITWSKVAKSHGFTAYRLHDNGIRFTNGSEIVFLDLTFYPRKDPLFERFGSKEFTGGWIEEAGEVHQKAYEVLKSRVGRHLNSHFKVPPKILITMNPKKNWVYSEVYKPWKENKLPENTAFVQSLPKDNKELPESYIESLHAIKDKALKERLLFGNWEYDDDPDALILYDKIIDSFDNDYIQPGPGRFLTCDVAMYGSDKFVIGGWSGFVLQDKVIMPKSGGKQVIDAIKRMQSNYQIPASNIIYDSDGVGAFIGGPGGFIPGAIAYNSNARPLKVLGKPDNYENLKTQLYYKMAERINEGGYWLKALNETGIRDECIEELEQVKSRDSDDDKTLKLIKKESVKESIGRSPDLSDMISMREYFELIPKPQARRSALI